MPVVDSVFPVSYSNQSIDGSSLSIKESAADLEGAVADIVWNRPMINAILAFPINGNGRYKSGLVGIGRGWCDLSVPGKSPIFFSFFLFGFLMRGCKFVL